MLPTLDPGTELWLIVLLPFAGSVGAALLPANARNAEAWLAGAVALAVTLLVVDLYPLLGADGVLRFERPWAPALGLAISLRMERWADTLPSRRLAVPLSVPP